MATPSERRNQLGNGRPLDARIHPYQAATKGHQSARVSGADTPLGFAIPNERQSDGHGGILFVSEGVGGALVHANHVRRFHNTDSRVPLTQQSLELTPDTHQNDAQGFVFAHRLKRCRNHHGRPAVATHGVNRDGAGFHRSAI